MTTKRIFAGGQADLAGQTFGTIEVRDFIQRRPLRWAGRCTQCGSEANFDHAALLSGAARCRNSVCGTDAVRAELSETPRQYRQKVEAQERAKQRQREEHEAAQIADAESTLTETMRQLYSTVRARIANGPDDEFFIDPATLGASMSAEQALAFNRDESAQFVRENPDYYPCDENLKAIAGYLERNGNLPIVSEATLKAAYLRLKEYGFIRERPKTPVPVPTLKATEILPVRIDHESDVTSNTQTGIDPKTGREREYTTREIDHMSADEYRRVFRIVRADLVLPNAGPGTKSLSVLPPSKVLKA